MSSAAPGFDAELEALIAFEAAQDPAIDAAVAAIIADVRARGDAALLECTTRFDKLDVPSAAALEISADEMRARVRGRCPTTQRDALATAAARIRAFHEAQKAHGGAFKVTEPDGTELGQRVTPLDRVGLYVPGGKAAYPSSVLMNAIPANVAGVRDIVMVVPTPGRRAQPARARRRAPRRRVARIHRSAARRRSRRSPTAPRRFPAVDKICGPGNAYVAAAKRRVFGTVGIDMVAGVSEILVIADATANPRLGRDRPVLAGRARRDGAGDPALAGRRADRRGRGGDAPRWLAAMPRAPIIAASLAKRGALVQVRDLAEACEIANRIAPEHLELAVADPDALLPRIRHAGAIFVGHHASEALGDYCAGPNHVLPTGRTARFSSPLGVYDFQKRSSVLRISPAGARALGPVAATLAHGEGLTAHARSAEARLVPAPAKA